MTSLCDELEDIIDIITPDDDPPLFDTEKSIHDYVETCLQLMYNFVDEDPTILSDPDFHDILLDDVKELFMDYFDFDDTYLYNQFDWEDELDDMLEYVYILFCDQIMPHNSVNIDPSNIESSNTDLSNTDSSNIDILAIKLKKLKSKPQHQQRTKEWYEYRHNLITASSAHKAFDSQSSKNQLIYEKCQPLNMEDKIISNKPACITGPLHWGQKYEPVSTLLYENMFNTKVADYGCIQHDTYKFLGASPDGIVSDPLLPRYGKMLEIKNIVNREITGIPKKEYWIQMQLQMETCDLDECDFLETKFVEYESFSDFNNDGTFFLSEKGEKKGIIMYFSTKDCGFHYIYKPLNMAQEYFDDVWEQEQMEQQEKLGMTWIKNIYWKLEKLSCVLVTRNKKWFEDNISILAEIWSTIEKERITGYEHRAPKKRFSNNMNNKIDTFFQTANTGCLLNKKSITPIIVNKIRTESMDETIESINSEEKNEKKELNENE